MSYSYWRRLLRNVGRSRGITAAELLLFALDYKRRGSEVEPYDGEFAEDSENDTG